MSVAAKCMSRNRFYKLKRFLHLADNTALDKADKITKLQPFMIIVNQSFQKFGIFHEELSIDEAMVKYYGRHPTKQFIQGKPIRFGYKNWILASSDSNCYAFDMYCGTKASLDDNKQPRQRKMPLGTKVVLDIIQSVQIPTDHIVFFDNYFFSFELFAELKKRGFCVTGTLQENHMQQCPLPFAKQIQKNSQGSHEFWF